MQRTEVPSFAARAIRPARLFQRVRRIQERPGLDGPIRLGDSCQGSANQIFGRDGPVPNPLAASTAVNSGSVTAFSFEPLH